MHEKVCCCRPWQQLQAALPWTAAAQAKQLQESIRELWDRHSSDDLVSMCLVLIDAYVTRVGRTGTSLLPLQLPFLAHRLHPACATCVMLLKWPLLQASLHIIVLLVTGFLGTTCLWEKMMDCGKGVHERL